MVLDDNDSVDDFGDVNDDSLLWNILESVSSYLNICPSKGDRPLVFLLK